MTTYNITEEIITQVRSKADILEVVQSRINSKLKRSGSNYTCCCPFHAESTPSFVISTNKNVATCFGACATTYDAIGFVQEFAGTDFIGAVTTLAQEMGLPLEERKQHYTAEQFIHQQEVRQHKLDLQGTMEAATVYYQKQLSQNSIASAYVQSRGISPEIAAQFKLGFAPNSYSNLGAVFEQYSNNELLKSCGLTKQSEHGKTYDAMRNRIVLPLLDSAGKTIAYSSRLIANLDNAPKYLNSPEHELFKKGEQLYGMYQAKQHIRTANCAILVEGNMDVLMMHQYGFTNTVASQGTAVTEQQLLMLFKICDKIIIMFDSDDAGIKASLKVIDTALPLLTDIKQIGFVFLPTSDGKCDPDSYLQSYGAAKMRSYIAEKEMALSKVLVGKIKKECGGMLDDAESKTKFLVKMQPYIAQLNAPITSVMMRQMLAEYLALDAAVIEAVLSGNTKQVFAKGGKLYGASRYTRSRAKAVAGKKVPSIYVRPLVIVQRMLLSNPKLATLYKFNDDVNSTQPDSTLSLVDYLANNCDVKEDIDTTQVQQLLDSDVHDAVGAAFAGGVVDVLLNSCEVTNMINAVCSAQKNI